MFPIRLKTARKKKDLLQRQLAAKLGISTSSYQKYEIGERAPSVATLVKIADVLEVTTDYLLGRVD